jgi:hypothetical protein
LEHVALFREELGSGVRVTVSTTARFMGLCGLQLLEHPERLRVFGFESAKPGDGQLAPFEQFAGTFQGRYFQEVVQMQGAARQFAVSFAPLYPDDEYVQRWKFAAVLQVALPDPFTERWHVAEGEALGKIVVEYSRLIRVGDSYVPVAP